MVQMNMNLRCKKTIFFVPDAVIAKSFWFLIGLVL